MDPEETPEETYAKVRQHLLKTAAFAVFSYDYDDNLAAACKLFLDARELIYG